MNEELADFLNADALPENFDAKTFIVNDESQAVWAMRNLATAQRRIDTVERLANEEHERIDRWVEYATKTQKNIVQYFTSALESYMLRLREEEDRKSLSLPDGDITSRSIPDKAAVSDLGVFLKWAQESGHSQWVRIKQEADLAALKDHVEFNGDEVIDSDTGETIDGLLHIEGAISVSIKVSE